MIGYLTGQIIHYRAEKLLLLVNNVGYEIIINKKMFKEAYSIDPKNNFLSLYIYQQQSEKQPKPVLYGFPTFRDKEFFELLLTVKSIWATKAAEIMIMPLEDIAEAVKDKDVKSLTEIKGIGKKNAERIIVGIGDKIEEFLPSQDKPALENINNDKKDISQKVIDILRNKMGYSFDSAEKIIEEAFKKNKDISTPEDLFDIIFK